MDEADFTKITQQLENRAKSLGFRQLAITDAQPGLHSDYLQQWLENGFHGEMSWMQDRFHLRTHPDQLHPGTLRVISVCMDYLQDDKSLELLNDPEKAYISRYALGRDYHKLMRKRLAELARTLAGLATNHMPDSRPFVDSAPVLERAFAEKAGLGWIGKNTLLIHPDAGSWFFLGEIYTNLPLPLSHDNTDKNDIPVGHHCGTCSQCLDICPTGAFAGPQQLDARKCISYLTIELEGVIPEALRPLMGNRVFGCDDCQLCCPFNKFARQSAEDDFSARHQLDDSTLLELFLWDETSFEAKTAGSPIRRIGYQRWLRNLSIGLGNAPHQPAIIEALQKQQAIASDNTRLHIRWALEQQAQKALLAKG